MADASDSTVVYVGFWTDYDLGGIRGWFLTLTTQNARVLMAGLVVLVAFAANRSWRIWSFVLHKALHTPANLTSLRVRQQQVILRNSETAGGAWFSLAILAQKSWGRFTKMAVARGILVLLAFCHHGSFVAFGILTSLIDAGRLVRSVETPYCGSWSSTKLGGTTQEIYDNAAVSNELVLNTTTDADNYARTCYGSRSEEDFGCGMMAALSLDYSTEMDRCPFNPSVCALSGEKSAFAMESTNISFSKLGFNFKLATELLVSRRTVCAPIIAEPFFYDQQQLDNALKGSDLGSLEEIRIYSHTYVSLDPPTNGTILFRNTSRDATYDLTAVMAQNGSLVVDVLQPQEPSMPVSVITLRGKTVSFYQPYTDPFFYATMELGSSPGKSNQTRKFYRMERPINSVACQDMTRYCSTITDYCTPWMGPFGIEPGDLSEKLFGGDESNEILTAFGFVQLELLKSTMYNAIGGRGARALQASRYLFEGTQTRISNDQWKVELEQWFRVQLAQLQRAPVRAIKIPELDFARVTNIWDSDSLTLVDFRRLCSMVKFRSPQHTTLSAAGIAVIIAFTVFVTLLSCAEYLIPYVSKSLAQPVLLWERDDVLELLKETEARRVVRYPCVSNQVLNDMLTVKGTKKRTG